MIDRSHEATSASPSAALLRLQRALDEHGIDARVEERAALAIIVPRGPHVSRGVRSVTNGPALDDTAPATAAPDISASDGEPAMTSGGAGTPPSSTSALGVGPEVRPWLVQAALDAGFSHVALEIVPSNPTDAPLPGRRPA